MENSLKQDNQQKVEQTVKASLQQTMERSMKEIEQASKGRHSNLQDLLLRLEKNDKERLEKVSSKHDTSMQAMENSLKQGLETIESETSDGLEDLKNHLNFHVSNIRQHQFEQIKSYQEKSEIEVKKIGENKNTLEMLTNLVRMELRDFNGNEGYAKYDRFEIGSESEMYALKNLGTYSGTAGDAMRYNMDEKFSTFDRDNDNSETYGKRTESSQAQQLPPREGQFLQSFPQLNAKRYDNLGLATASRVDTSL
ncbi:ryncolin-4-like [Anopheles ziemanni]|uniref:ryncolin-4-like n=1 Tax=Anopheles coustani TaxID=139045 RepID=UPI00265B52EF|nr:ryncolin-4-like [Anopheles coustani]XP_058177026.1 ryncolin-4-like [Anopheles ziemanni]